MKKTQQIIEQVSIEKIVFGGQGLATLGDGRKVFVWNALPGEVVDIEVYRNKRTYAEAIARNIVTASPDRITPKDDNFLSTSPWQIISEQAEKQLKHRLVKDVFMQEHLQLPDFAMIQAGDSWQYRNKMEYSFWGDEDGLHLALYNRGTHTKQIVEGCSLALPSIDVAANELVSELQQQGVRAGDLKSVIVRSSQNGGTIAALFVKQTDFPKISLPTNLEGLTVFYSNPKSPASLPTKQLYQLGTNEISDEIAGKKLFYNAQSFFQVNIQVFEQALQRIKQYAAGSKIVDMYSGVGTIGLCVGADNTILVEVDDANIEMMRKNIAGDKKISVVHTSSEQALDSIKNDSTIIFDPPRAGLHKKVIQTVLDVRPKQLIYLSCNPTTQARDIALLQKVYEISFFEGYNFFPHTPHIETLAVMIRR